MKSTIKFTFDKRNLPCDLSCVIESGQLNIVLPFVEGQPSKAAETFSHTNGVLFVIGGTRQHGNPLHCGRHARSWLRTAQSAHPESAPLRTHQKELNSAAPEHPFAWGV
jgi:hypothetical protein